MNILLGLLVGALFWFVLGEVSAWVACGPLLFDCDEMEIDLEKYYLHPPEPKILSYENGPFIASPVHQYTAKYYIFKVGRVPRWSKLHARIEDRRKQLLDLK